MARRKRVTVGAKRVKIDAKPTAAKRRGVILSHCIAYEPPDPDRVSLIATSALERIHGGGLLFQSADRWSSDLDFVNTVRQQALAALGIKIAMLNPFVLQGEVEPSSDGLYHLDVEIDGTTYTIRLRYPLDGAGSPINSVVAVTLPPGSAATAVLQNGVLTIGVPRGADGQHGTSVTDVTVTTLPPDADATANFNPATGVLQLGIPRGQGVTSVTANTLPPSTVQWQSVYSPAHPARRVYRHCFPIRRRRYGLHTAIATFGSYGFSHGGDADMTEALSIIRSVLELGFPAVVLLQVWMIWRAYERRVNEHIRDLRAAVQRTTCHDLFAEPEQQ